MKFNRIKVALFALILAVAFILIVPLSACLSISSCNAPKLSFIKTQGEKIVNEEGEEVTLRGVNAGGLFVIEMWMNGFIAGKYERAVGKDNKIEINYRDHRTATQVMLDRFGKEKTKKLWAEYRANWWSEEDFKNCAEMGINVIRLPFTYMTVDFDAIESYDNAGKNYDFSLLDEFVKKAAQYGMYTILDLHGAYGSQNGQDHSGQTMDSKAEVDFYTNEKMMDLTAGLWGALAKHFKNNSNVAGYDILNEPGEKGGSTSKLHWDFYDKTYDAIREQDKDHIVIFESCWAGNNLPQPSEYGWENCMYSFHHYTSKVDDYEAHCTDFNNRIDDILSMNFGVPLQIGEFTCYNNLEQWEYTLSALNRAGIHWVTWTYKINNNWRNSAWGIVQILSDSENKVDVAEDSYEDIISKFKILKTTKDDHFCTFTRNGEEITLFSIIQANCNAENATLEEGNYLFKDSVRGFYLSLETTVGGKNVLGLNDKEYSVITVSAAAVNGSLNLTVDNQKLSTVTVGSNTYVGIGGSTANSRFFPVLTESGGYAFIAYSNCRYLTVGGDGSICADGQNIEQAAVFNLEKI